MRIVVVLPAPFGPSRANTPPPGTDRSSPSTALTAPNAFPSPSASIAADGSDVIVMVSMLPAGGSGVVVLQKRLPAARRGYRGVPGYHAGSISQDD
jgi:hypothetical protein